MGLQAGGHLGIYEILSPLGKGGMGEVYRARDTRLNRDVAIKVLPQAFAEDPFRMARFEREAHLLASLNHPKIAAIYGLEVSGSTHALVMELVEGPTLEEHIGRASASARSKAASASASQGNSAASAGSGSKSEAKSGSGSRLQEAALPLDEALPIAQQVAEALEYAHEHGVVHRDLKPANIKVMVDGCVKVLDFGLAKAMGPDEASGDISNSPTLSIAMTQEGLILGTAAYMAPEQAKGKQVDRRVDIWAFGCVLYEMLTGKKTFEGETISDVLAAVIRADPDWTALPEATPRPIQQLVRRCLEKDPKHRLRDIGDARIAIEEALSGEGDDTEAGSHTGPMAEGRQRSRLRRSLPWALGMLAILFAASTAWLMLQPKPRQHVVRFAVPEPENASFVYGGEMSLSPDGRMLAFVAQPGPDKPPVLWLRPLDSLTARPIPGTEDAFMPFWSPDSQQIGFFTNDKLEKVAASGGAPQELCAMSGFGATWNQDGVILFSSQRSLYEVPDTGGTPTLVLAPDPADQATAYSDPQFLPDGRHFLVVVNTPGTQANILGAGSLDSKSVKRLARTTTQVNYASPGEVFYLDQSTLMARPFDARALRFTGAAVPVAQSIGRPFFPGYGYFSVSSAGVLAYTVGYTTIQNTVGQMTWFNRAGVKQGELGQPDIWSTPELSPDGTRLAAARGEVGKQDIWVFDLKRGTASRLTFSPADDTNPTWLPDGSQIFFSSTRKGPFFGIYQKDADGLGSTQVVSQSSSQAIAINGVSPDGRYAIYDTAGGPDDTALWVLPLFGDRKPFPFVQGKFGATHAQISPNGRYVAYTSNETGRHEVYVQTFPQHTGKWQISTAGGEEPMWRRDGKELFYLSRGDNATGGDKLMSVAVDTNAAAFQAGIPKELFQAQLNPLWLWRNVYAVSPDGQRFLMILPAAQVKPQPITVVLNWPSLLKK